MADAPVRPSLPSAAVDGGLAPHAHGEDETPAHWAFGNPAPQPRPDRLGDGSGDPVPLELAGVSLDAAQDKIALVMVGLPGSGKTHLSRRIARYLEFFHSVQVRTVTTADYRREIVGAVVPAAFYDDDNEEGKEQRQICWNSALEDLTRFFNEEDASSNPTSPASPSRPRRGGDAFCASDDGGSPRSRKALGRIGFFDSTNLTRKHRADLVEALHDTGAKVIFLEVLCTDPSLVEAHIKGVQARMPDYAEMPDGEAARDFHQRRENLKAVYEEVNAAGDEEHLSWVKITNLETFTINRVRSYLPGRIVQFLLNLHPKERTIFISRHGQSEYNELGKVGGDSNLTAKGLEYAKRLAKFAEEKVCRDARGEVRPARLWTSTLQRTRQTAQFIQHPTITRNGQNFIQMRDKRWTNLDEIYAGICDGFTYEEIAEKYPEEARRRAENKLSYRYPRGESYMDLIQRLEPIVHEIERHQEPLLLIGHQAVLRIIYCYLKGIPRDLAPKVPMPLHTIVKMEPHAYECEEETILLMTDAEGDPLDTPSH